MNIREFPRENQDFFRQGAELLRECFPQAYSGERADQEMARILEEDRIALMAEQGGRLVGLIGAMPQYGVTAWELHPLAVTASHRLQGVGSALVAKLEQECSSQGCITLYLGTDDEFGQTTLSGTNLFQDTFGKIERIENLHGHPYQFYQKQGFQIVGVLPDANGPGKPDIFMAKGIGK